MAHHSVDSFYISTCPQEHLEELVRQSFTLGGLLVLHQPNLIFEMCSTNVASQQRCVAPLGHFVKAAERLDFNQDQLTHLRLMLRQYNRSMQLQLQKGLGLLQLSKASESLQAAAATAQAAQAASKTSSAAAAAGDACQVASVPDVGCSKDSYSRQPVTQTGTAVDGSSNSKACSSCGGHSKQQEEGGNDDESEEGEAELSDQLQQHLSERMQVMQVR